MKIWDAGTIVFPKSGESIRSEVRARLASPMAVVGHLACLTCKNIDPSFGFFLLQNILFSAKIEQTSLPALSLGYIKEFPVLVPPLVEQQKIASVLSDLDALIEAQEALIAKKKDIKAATMELLLTGKKRLPGFSDQWSSYNLDMIVTLRSEKTTLNGKALTIELEHVGQGTGTLLGKNEAYFSNKTIFYPGDVLFGKLRAYLRKYWLADKQGVCSTEFWVMQAKKEVLNNNYLYQLVQTDKFIEAASNSHGTHMPRSDWKVVGSTQIGLPPFLEQSAIATVLNSMDNEISLLRFELTKLKEHKSAAMHKLLTGEIRLA